MSLLSALGFFFAGLTVGFAVAALLFGDRKGKARGQVRGDAPSQES
jgi:hypothetical protein